MAKVYLISCRDAGVDCDFQARGSSHLTLSLDGESGSNVNKSLREGHFNAELRDIGLEPTKDAYREKIREIDKLRGINEQSRLYKFLFGKRDKGQVTESAASKSCKDGKKCKPIPTPQALPPPCLAGSDPLTSWCRPWGYLEACDGRGYCRAHLEPVDYSNCDGVLRQLKLEETVAADLKNFQQPACSVAAQSANCAATTSALQKAESRVVQFRKQYKMCLMAARPLWSNTWPLLQSIPSGGP